MITTISRMRQQKEEGFTLIELMIVIVVLGILAAIVLFAVGPFKDNADKAKSTANAKQCTTAKAADEAYFASTGTSLGYMKFVDGTDDPCTP